MHSDFKLPQKDITQAAYFMTGNQSNRQHMNLKRNTEMICEKNEYMDMQSKRQRQEVKF